MNTLTTLALCVVLELGQPTADASPAPRALDQQLTVFTDSPRHVLLDGLDEQGKRYSRRLNVDCTFEILQPPAHGELFGEASAVRYLPDVGYRGEDHFTFRLLDNGRASAAGTVRLTVCDWSSPVGVPAPEFGIEQTHRMYEEQQYDFGQGPAAYRCGSDGPYTHYVDNTHPAAEDDANPFGSPQKPRKTIPVELPAGSVVEVHGGPYVQAEWGFAVVADGTRERPVFVRAVPGQPPVRIEAGERGKRVMLAGSYLVVENFHFKKLDVKVGTSGEPPRKRQPAVDRSDHIALRHCEIQEATGGAAVAAGGSHAVVLNNYVHHTGNHDEPDDRHGLHAGAAASHVWLLDNHVHHSSGDGVQFCHGAREQPPKFVYVGRNVFHDDVENAIDIKYAADVIVSQNVCYGYQAVKGEKVGSDGSAIVLGSDGCPDRVWVLLNEIFDSAHAIRNEATRDAWIIGNLMHNIDGRAIALEKQATDLRIVNNTVVGANVAIDQFWRPNFRLQVAGNIFAGLRGEKAKCDLNIESPEVASQSVLGKNLFWMEGRPLTVRWGTQKPQTFDSPAALAKVPALADCLVEDPRFQAADRHNYMPAKGSPAIDAGSEHPAYNEFRRLYGLGIQVDFLGTPRPQGRGWDLGALEFAE